MVSDYKWYLRWRSYSRKVRDFVLIKELYNCSPSAIEDVEEEILDAHYMMLIEERKYERDRQKEKDNKQRAINLSKGNRWQRF